MLIKFHCPKCQSPLNLDPAMPGKCGKCGEAFAGDVTYAGSVTAVTQCAVCRSPQLKKQKWTDRYSGPGTTLMLLLLIVPTRGMSLLLPLLGKLVLDAVMPGQVRCLRCGCVHT